MKFSKLGETIDETIAKSKKSCKRKAAQVKKYTRDHDDTLLLLGISMFAAFLLGCAVMNFSKPLTAHGVTSVYAAEQPQQVELGRRTRQNGDTAGGMPQDAAINEAEAQIMSNEDAEAAEFYDKLLELDKLPAMRSVDKEAVRLSDEFEKAKTAPMPEMDVSGGRINFCYGAMTPRIQCKPFRLTDIELETNERVEAGGVYIADSGRWKVDIGTSGDADRLRVHIVVKPFYPDIATNMVIHTNKRTYSIELVSKNSESYMQYVGFTYNREISSYSQDLTRESNSKQMTALQQKYQQQDAVRAAKVKAQMRQQQHKIDMSKICKNYTITCNKGKEPTWMPQAVYDVGNKTYIKLDENVHMTETPSFFVIKDAKEKLVNYRVYKSWYIIDSIFEKGVLKIGGDKVTIKRNQPLSSSAAAKRKKSSTVAE